MMLNKPSSTEFVHLSAIYSKLDVYIVMGISCIVHMLHWFAWNFAFEFLHWTMILNSFWILLCLFSVDDFLIWLSFPQYTYFCSACKEFIKTFI